MLRKIIKIDQEKCNGCGLCAGACHEGAIIMEDGKAELIRDDYCDGLGNCLPVCPTGAISFEMREAAAFDEAAVAARIESAKEPAQPDCASLYNESACPGVRPVSLDTKAAEAQAPAFISLQSELQNFPVQIRLAAVNAPFFRNARLLIAADCAAYAHGDFHRRFMQQHVTLIGCPKLDDTDYSDKLTEILRANDIRSVTVVRMEVPCCGGLSHAVIKALKDCGKMIPWQMVTLSSKGEILAD